MANHKREVLCMTGGTVYATAPVSDEPAIDLRGWAVHEVKSGDVTEQFIIGAYLDADYGRLSTPVQQLDFSARSARTTSGRLYRLHGPPGPHPDGTWLWRAVFKATPYEDVTAKIWAQMRKGLQ